MTTKLMAIRVERSESPASVGDARMMIERLEREPGAWLGCDVSVEGLYRREAIACADPALAFYLDGNTLRIVPRTPTGHAIAASIEPLHAFERREGRLEIGFGNSASVPHPVIAFLRRFLALFAPACSELGLYGAFAFDFYRLESGDAIPQDGRRRMALFFPERVLITGDAGHRWITFRFPDLVLSSSTPVPAEPTPARLESRTDDHPPGGHAAAVARGVERLARGELASLVLSQTFRRPVQTSLGAAFATLRAANPYPAMFFLNLGGGETVFGASPDLQVRADATWVETAPVCGTVRRGLDPLDDYAQARELFNSEVDEASLAVCGDSDRNDKAKVCVPGSVELVSRRRLHFFSTIIHAIDHNRGRRRADADAFDILLAHSTPATVTGMPKRTAVAAIEALEPGWRGWYAGAAVRIGCDRSLEALTMLRFARVIDGWAEVRTGGSLLADSDPQREEAETRLKAESLFRVLAGGSPTSLRSAPDTPPTHTVRLIDIGDPLGPLAREALVRAGTLFADDAGISVLGDGTTESARATLAGLVDGPLLAINNAGLALLENEGAEAERLPRAQFARSIEAHATESGFLSEIGTFTAGIYSDRRLLADRLPSGWIAIALGTDRRVLVAAHPGQRRCAILFRADSALSSRHDAGIRVLAAALAWLAHDLPRRAT